MKTLVSVSRPVKDRHRSYCERCHKTYTKNSNRQLFCGSKSLKTGCSWIHKVEVNRAFSKRHFKEHRQEEYAYRREYYAKNREKLTARSRELYRLKHAVQT